MSHVNGHSQDSVNMRTLVFHIWALPFVSKFYFSAVSSRFLKYFLPTAVNSIDWVYKPGRPAQQLNKKIELSLTGEEPTVISRSVCAISEHVIFAVSKLFFVMNSFDLRQ